MKVIDKETKGIVDLDVHETGDFRKQINSIAELTSKYEDYEEPKTSALDIMILTLIDFIENEPDEDKLDLEDCKQMLDKLKAWQRLKDKGFEFTGLTSFYTGRGSQAVNYSGTPVTISFNKSMDVLGQDWIKDNKKDLELLFGGEE